MIFLIYTIIASIFCLFLILIAFIFFERCCLRSHFYISLNLRVVIIVIIISLIFLTISITIIIVVVTIVVLRLICLRYRSLIRIIIGKLLLLPVVRFLDLWMRLVRLFQSIVGAIIITVSIAAIIVYIAVFFDTNISFALTYEIISRFSS